MSAITEQIEKLSRSRSPLLELAGSIPKPWEIRILPSWISDGENYIARYSAQRVAARAEYDTTLAETADRLSAVERELQQLDAAVRPLPGSPDEAALAQRVRQLYERRAADEAIRDELQNLEAALAYDEATDLVAAARAEAARALPDLLREFARRTVADVAEAIQTERLGDLTGFRAIAETLVQQVDQYVPTVVAAERLAGMSFDSLVPRIEFDDLEAWRAIQQGRVPHVVVPPAPAAAEPTPPAPDPEPRPGIGARLRSAIGA